MKLTKNNMNLPDEMSEESAIVIIQYESGKCSMEYKSISDAIQLHYDCETGMTGMLRVTIYTKLDI